jgi:group I intron endonuclease
LALRLLYIGKDAAMDIYSIYLITNLVNDKKYVGFTNDPPQRWRSHKSLSSQSRISQAIQKYGIDNFTFEVIYQSLDKDHTFNVMEQYFINLYGTRKSRFGYNRTDGGQGALCSYRSVETRQKVSEALKGIKRSEETKRKMSIAKTGVCHTEEAKQKMSAARKGKSPSNKGIPRSKETVEKMKISRRKFLYTIYHEDGKVEETTSMREYASLHSIHNAELSNVCNGKRKKLGSIIKIVKIKLSDLQSFDSQNL